jgi:hypothetical protein
MTFWCGSGSGCGSAGPCLWQIHPDSDPDPGSGSCYFRHRPSRCQKILIFYFIFSAYYFLFLKAHLHLFSKIKSQKESQNSRNQGFSYYYCIIERSRSGSGSIPLTNGPVSGSWNPKNMWIRWIRIRIRIRIHNTALKSTLLLSSQYFDENRKSAILRQIFYGIIDMNGKGVMIRTAPYSEFCNFTQNLCGIKQSACVFLMRAECHFFPS